MSLDLLVLSGGVVVGGLAGYALRHMVHLRAHARELAEQVNLQALTINEQNRAIDELSKPRQRRIPQALDACLLDGMAVALDTILEAQQTADYLARRQEQLRAILAAGRDQYDTDRPAGERPGKGKK